MNLRWNSSDYGGVKDLRIPPHRIWKPGEYYISPDSCFSFTFHIVAIPFTRKHSFYLYARQLDVLMYNSADEGFDGTYPTNVVVKNNGSCVYIPPGKCQQLIILLYLASHLANTNTM